jgi:hypothetical protein
MRFLEARNAEKCTIRPSYSASVRTREANEPCSAGARGEGLLGLADRRPGDLGLAEDGLLQDRAATPDVSAKPAQHLDAAFIRLTSQQMRRKHTFALKCPAHLLRPQPARGRVDREGETPHRPDAVSPLSGVARISVSQVRSVSVRTFAACRLSAPGGSCACARSTSTGSYRAHGAPYPCRRRAHR